MEALELPEVFARRTAEPVRCVRIRAYADRDYRAHSPTWRERIVTQIENASAVTEDEFGVRLEIDSIREWERSGEADLAKVLDLLVREDPAFDVDWVVGFTGRTAPPEHRPDFVGRASWFGRHFVVRALDSAAPHTLFLHEWGHSLGAVHDCAGNWSMSVPYGIMRSAFSPESAWLIRLGLRQRDGRGEAARRAWVKAYAAGASRIEAAWPDCKDLKADLRYMHRLLFYAAHAYGPVVDGRQPETAWERWCSAIAHPLHERLESEAGRVKAGSVLPRHDPTDRVVVVNVSFEPSGAVTAVEVLLRSGFAPLDDAVVDVVRRYSYPIPPADLAPGERGFTYSFKSEF